MKLLPPPGVGRQLAVQSLVYAIGNGVFTAGSAVFFVRVVGLSATQVGIGLSLAGLITLVLSVPVGGLTDRFGAKRAWLAASFAEAVAFCAYPLVRGFWPFLLVIGAAAVANAVNSTGRTAYTIQALDRDERVRVLAYSRSALNLGFTFGGLLAGAVIAIDTTAAYDVLVLANAAGLLAGAAAVIRMPDVAAEPRARASRFAALRDRPFLAVTALCGLLLSFSTVFENVIPLWIVTRTDAPRSVVAVLFVINTVLVILLQVVATRGAETLSGAARALRRSGWIAALACPLLWFTGSTPVVLTVALLVVAIVLITGAELWQQAGQWSLSTALPPAGRRGEYVGTFRLGTSAQSMAGPAALTWLAIGTGGWGWLVIAGLFAVGALASAPVVRWAETTPRLGAVPV